MDNENFYIALPNVWDSKLVIFKNNKFEKCHLKCGEIIGETFEERYRNTKYTGGMDCIFKFYIDTNLIDKKRQKNFDTVLFAHNDVLNKLSKTIWKNCKYPPESVGRNNFSQENMEFSKLLNYWISITPDSKNYIDCIKKYSTEEIDIKHDTIKKFIKHLFNCNFNKLVEDYTKTDIIKNSVNLFKHQCLVLEQLCYLLNAGKKNIVTQIPCRFGKTLTFLHLFANSPWTVMVVSSYTKTVGNSYTNEINKYDDFKNIQTVNIDDISEFKPTGGKIVIEFPTTGSVDGTIERRIENMRKIVNMVNAKSSDMFLLNEEADYGQHTEKTNEKFEKFMCEFNQDGKMTIISTTGTEAFKAEKLNAFGKFDGKISVNENDWHQIIM